MKLYELNEQWLKVSELLEEDVTNEALKETLESINDSIEVKLEYLVKLKREHESQARQLKEEKEYFAHKQKVEENKADRLKEFIEYQMNLTETNWMMAGLFKLSIQDNPPSLKISTMAGITEEFLLPQAPKLDMVNLKKWIKEGNEIEGVQLIQTRSLRIR